MFFLELTLELSIVAPRGYAECSGSYLFILSVVMSVIASHVTSALLTMLIC